MFQFQITLDPYEDFSSAMAIFGESQPTWLTIVYRAVWNKYPRYELLSKELHLHLNITYFITLEQMLTFYTF